VTAPVPYEKGDVVSYVRNTDGTTVTGKVKHVHDRLSLPGQSSVLFGFWSLPAYKKEYFAYRLRLDEKEAERVGHPVTIGHSRIKQ
jgi:hypothetical protein